MLCLLAFSIWAWVIGKIQIQIRSYRSFSIFCSAILFLNAFHFIFIQFEIIFPIIFSDVLLVFSILFCYMLFNCYILIFSQLHNLFFDCIVSFVFYSVFVPLFIQFCYILFFSIFLCSIFRFYYFLFYSAPCYFILLCLELKVLSIEMDPAEIRLTDRFSLKREARKDFRKIHWPPHPPRAAENIHCALGLNLYFSFLNLQL